MAADSELAVIYMLRVSTEATTLKQNMNSPCKI